MFSSSRAAGIQDLYQKSISGTDEDELLLRSGRSVRGQDWSLDGRFIVYDTKTPTTKLDLWLLPLFGDRKPVVYLQTPFNEVVGQVSPDGHWMAYASDESGNWEVYVQSFPVAGGKRTISTHGGSQPKWRRDGRELFYMVADNNIMAVDVKAGSTLEIGVPRPLFQTHYRGSRSSRNDYAVTSDGQRFLVDTADDMGSRSGITVFLNWMAVVRK